MNQLTNHIKDKTWESEREIHITRNWQCYFSSDIVLATYSGTQSNFRFSFWCRKTEARQTAHIAKEFSRELIPLSTFILIQLPTLYNHSILASLLVMSRSYCLFCLRFDRNSLLCNKTNVQLIQFGRSKVAVIHHLIHTHTGWDWEYHWYRHVEWTCERCQHSYPR